MSGLTVEQSWRELREYLEELAKSRKARAAQEPLAILQGSLRVEASSYEHVLSMMDAFDADRADSTGGERS